MLVLISQMQQLNFLRSFIPEKCRFGNDFPFSNEEWSQYCNDIFTLFETSDQYIKVIFSYNPQWKCTELSFKSILKDKAKNIDDIIALSSYLPDLDMTLDANRGTEVFRKVVFVAFSKIQNFDKIGFNGATPFLDRIYSRLNNLEYFKYLIKNKKL